MCEEGAKSEKKTPSSYLLKYIDPLFIREMRVRKAYELTLYSWTVGCFFININSLWMIATPSIDVLGQGIPCTGSTITNQLINMIFVTI